MNLIEVDFTPYFRQKIYRLIKDFGAKTVEVSMIAQGHHPSFVKALIKSILAKEGW